jgi:hypothetical protein
MPILFMALLALLIFGLIGILLTVAVILEHSKRRHSAKFAASTGAALSVTSGALPSLDSKL